LTGRITHIAKSNIQTENYMYCSPALKKIVPILVAVLWLFQEKRVINNGVGV
jgi:hypothetical protein